MRFLCLFVALLLICSSAFAWDRAFDMGTDNSPLAQGYTRVTEKSLYDGAAGFGWTEPCSDSFYRSKVSPQIVEGEIDPMLADGVANKEERTFRIDLPDGKYTIELFLGDLGGAQLWASKVEGYPGGPVYSMEVTLNGEVAASDVNAYTIGDRRSPATFVGGVARLVLDAEAKDGCILIGFRGNDSAYLARKAADEAAGLTDLQKENVARGVRQNKPPTRWLGGPYDHFSVLGLRVASGTLAKLYPYQIQGGKLASSQAPASSPFETALSDYNAGKLQSAATPLDAVKPASAADRLKLGYLYLALAGHPRTENESELLSKAIDNLKEASALPAAEILLEDARSFAQGIKDFDRRGYHGENPATNHFRAEADFRRIGKESPLYFKAQVYRGRIFGSQDPARWTWMWPECRAIFKAIEPDFRDNRYVKFYLSKDAMGGIARATGFRPEDDIRAQGTGEWRDDWDIPSYTEGTENAPEWAVQLREAYCRMLDHAEWWIKNRQIEDGEIGGGFGDDVEIVALWGYAGFICEDAAPVALQGAKRMVDGIWESDEIDRDVGYWNGPVTWVKIPAEFTGYSEPMMMALEYGNPEYYERNLRTVKTMRDFGTYVNKNGSRHFRTGYFNSSRHSNNPLQRVDPALAWRCTLGAGWLSWYSRDRGAEQLMREWADSWLRVAMGTERGKPAGVVPSIMSSELDLPGAPNSSNWYDAPDPNNMSDYIFPSYTRYIYSLFTNMYLKTGIARFLDPLKITLDLQERGKGIDWTKEPAGSEPWVNGLLFAKVGSTADQCAAQLHKMAAIKDFDRYIAEFATGWEKFMVTGDSSEITQGLKGVNFKLRDSWPIMTSDVAITDMIAPPGLIPVIATYLGGFGTTYEGFPGFTVSYEKMSKNFAALVRDSTSRDLTIAFFNFEADAREIAIVPWALEAGAAYKLEAGPDANGDYELDQVASSSEFTLEHRADPVSVTLPSREVLLVRIQQVGPPPQPVPLADLAISTKDVEYRSHGESAIHVTVHNIGNAAADEISLAVYKGDSPVEQNLIGRAIISHLSSPGDLDAQMIRASVLYSPSKTSETFCVVIDPDDEIPEITERNNVIVKTLSFSQDVLKSGASR